MKPVVGNLWWSIWQSDTIEQAEDFKRFGGPSENAVSVKVMIDEMQSDTTKTGFNKYTDKRMKDPAFAQEYRRARAEIADVFYWQGSGGVGLRVECFGPGGTHGL